MDLERIKKAYRDRDRKREQLRKETLRKVLAILKTLSDEVTFEAAYIFGSLIKERSFGEHSDVDIAFKGLDRDQLFYVTGCISSKLERDVNAVHLEDIHFKETILKEGLLWKKD